jgi:hypothetical protein
MGQPVTDQTLVLTCLRGLNARFSDITTLVMMQNPLPSFLQTRSLLLLRETQLQHAAPLQQQTALYGAGSNVGNYGQGGGYGYGQGSGYGQPYEQGYSGNSNNGSGRYRGKKKTPAGHGGTSGGGNPTGGGYYRSNSDPRPAPVGP